MKVLTSKSCLVLLVLIVTSLGLGSWTFWQPEGKVRIRRANGVSTVDLREFLLQDFNPYSNRSEVRLDIATLAALAANVYEPDRYDKGCSPERRGRIALKGWTRWTDWPAPRSCKEELSDLRYEVWKQVESTASHEMVYIAIVFRGTLPTLAHWCSNLRTLKLKMCNPQADQYLHIAPLVVEIMKRIKDELGPGLDFHTIAVGHSLGGGLAELAGRASYIDQVFSFDSSPELADEISTELEQANYDWALYRKIDEDYERLTGCEASRDDYATAATIWRVYEHGEILSYLRLLKRGFVPGDAKVVEYRTNILKGGWVDQHSMKALACALRRKAAKLQLEMDTVSPNTVHLVSSIW
jgi:hypothetical protein